jgi:ketosteroid isomerase-like protein
MNKNKSESLLERFPVAVLGAHVAAARAAKPASGSAEERLAQLELEAEARAFITKYSYFFDGKDLEALMTLYASDCVLVNTAGTYVGIDAIRRMQEGDIGRTAISFHHFNNPLVVIEDLKSRTAYVTAFMYNLAVRDDEHYGTVGTVVFCLKGQADGSLKASAIRIAIDSRHTLQPKFVPIGEPGPHAASGRSSYDLVGRKPRFPANA